MDESLPQSEEDANPVMGIVFESEEAAALWDAALSYRKVLESAPTADTCLCHWTQIRAKRVLTNVHPLCPVHSREGVLVGFIECLRTLPQWTVVFKPAHPDPNGATLEVQSAVQGSATNLKLPGLHPMDMPELIVETRTTLEWLALSPEIKAIKDGDGFTGIDVDNTLITKADFNSRIAASTVEYWPIDAIDS